MSVPLPDWTDPPTREVPRVLQDPSSPGSKSVPGPVWRQNEADWDLDSIAFAELVSEGSPVVEHGSGPVEDEFDFGPAVTRTISSNPVQRPVAPPPAAATRSFPVPSETATRGATSRPASPSSAASPGSAGPPAPESPGSPSAGEDAEAPYERGPRHRRSAVTWAGILRRKDKDDERTAARTSQAPDETGERGDPTGRSGRSFTLTEDVANQALQDEADEAWAADVTRPAPPEPRRSFNLGDRAKVLFAGRGHAGDAARAASVAGETGAAGAAGAESPAAPGATAAPPGAPSLGPDPGALPVAGPLAAAPPGATAASTGQPHAGGRFFDRATQPGESGPRRSPVVATLTGLGIGGVALVCFLAGPPAALAFSCVLIIVAMAECYHALRQAHYRPAALLGLVAAPAAAILGYLKGTQGVLLVTALLVIVSFCWYLFGVTKKRPVANLSATLFGWLWVGALGSFAGLLLSPAAFSHRHGIAYLLGAAEATVAYDVGGYAFGSWLGKHKLAPSISPNKTWEGLLGGSLSALVVAVAITALMSPWTLPRAAALGLVVAVVAPLGDLAESMVKRDLHLKDMGSLLPAHGGLLDRVDALLFVLPATYYLVRAFHG